MQIPRCWVTRAHTKWLTIGVHTKDTAGEFQANCSVYISRVWAKRTFTFILHVCLSYDLHETHTVLVGKHLQHQNTWCLQKGYLSFVNFLVLKKAVKFCRQKLHNFIPNISKQIKYEETEAQRSGLEHIPFVFGMDISSVVEKVLHNRHTVIARGKVQGCRMPALQISAIHVLRAAELLLWCMQTHRETQHHYQPFTDSALKLCSILDHYNYTVNILQMRSLKC